MCDMTHLHVWVGSEGDEDTVIRRYAWRMYGVATISELLKITGLFCKRAL